MLIFIPRVLSGDDCKRLGSRSYVYLRKWTVDRVCKKKTGLGGEGRSSYFSEGLFGYLWG